MSIIEWIEKGFMWLGNQFTKLFEWFGKLLQSIIEKT